MTTTPPEIRQALLPNGIPVICEKLPYLSTVTFSIYISAGSRDETKRLSGMLHFLEHMIFKGTKTRSQKDIAIETDILGGNIDAYVSREGSCFSAHVVINRFEQAFSLLADMVTSATFPKDEIENERKVIIEEIRSAEDSPSEVLHDAVYKTVFGDHPLSRQITGDIDSVQGISYKDLIEARELYYKSPRIVVAACGNIDISQVVESAEKAFGSMKPVEHKREFAKISYEPKVKIINKKLEQVRLMLVRPAISMQENREAELSIADSLIGACVSSHLFQKIREERGLAYSISSFYELYEETGFFAISSATSPDRIEELVDTIFTELENFDPTDEEIERTKQTEFENLLMSLESSAGRIHAMTEQKVYYGRVYTREEMENEIRNVSAQGVRKIMKELSLTERGYCAIAVGPLKNTDRRFLEKEVL